MARAVDLVLAAYALVVPVGLACRTFRRGCPDGAGQPLKLDVEGTVGLKVGFGDRVLGVRVAGDLRDQLVELLRSDHGDLCRNLDLAEVYAFAYGGVMQCGCGLAAVDDLQVIPA